MDHDQEKFYEDEDQEVRAEAQQPSAGEDIDDMKYFLELLKHIRAAIRSGANVPLTNKKIIDAEKCLMIIDDMERNLPDAVQYGMQMFSERDRILGNAETAAMNRVSSAEMRANAALEKAKNEAIELAVEAGAVRETVEIIEMEDVPLAYYPGNTNRVKIKAAGDLN